jgi:hypothetical protein
MTTLGELYHAVHGQLREEINDVEETTLNWTPGPDTNSIGTLLVHLLATEEEVLRSIRSMPSDRDRVSEFAARSYTRDELLGCIRTADATLDDLFTGLLAEDLRSLRTRPVRPEVASGLFWLLRNYGHSREHLAHLQLTKQLYRLAHPVDGTPVFSPTS